MELETFKELRFTKECTKHSFNVKYNFSFISLNKIILKSHLNTESNVWASLLSNTNLIIREFESGEIKNKYQFSLMQFLSVNHRFPMLEVSIEIPSKSERNNFSLSKFFDKIEIEIDITDENITDYDYIIYYEKTPGILKIDSNV